MESYRYSFFSLLLGLLMKSSGLFKKISDETAKIKKKGIVSLISPMLIGLIPMPGGALISAPLVEVQLKDTDLSRARMAFINYWYRHIWEYAWPLYPGIVVMSGLIHYSVKSIIFPLIPFVFVAFLSGLFFIKGIKDQKPLDRFSFIKFLLYVSPIVFVIIAILLGFNIILTLLIPNVILFLISIWKKTFSMNTMNFSVFPAIFFIFLFKAIFGIAFRIESHPYFPGWVIFVFIILFALLSGFITGLNQAAVGIVIPFIIMISPPENLLFNSIVGYVSLFLGILISPSHLCLVLTAKYFNTDLASMYRYIFISMSIVVGFAIVWFFIIRILNII